MRQKLGLILLAVFFGITCSAHAQEVRPLGYMALCLTQQQLCTHDYPTYNNPNPYPAEKETLGLLQKVNDTWNQTIVSVADPPGAEQWTGSTTHGDCEEFAVAKRNDLLRRGFHASQVLLVRVLTQNNEGHLITVVRLSTGVYVLDNLRSEVVPFEASGYSVTLRQREDHPYEWTTQQL